MPITGNQSLQKLLRSDSVSDPALKVLVDKWYDKTNHLAAFQQQVNQLEAQLMRAKDQLQTQIGSVSGIEECMIALIGEVEDRRIIAPKH